ncbi:type II toxin-antitoxin system PemK/MazF family toxin [Arthrobacter sp.]|uniref:type II toxin-antitoxin system PemK/MazF family toxin n=1 Tax=Arthrobacter sp. TaxID=1667 RepID=UPI00289D4542|nr:type II toxin-antitoxin system PemK/MazF family toxin [Arthrobacter sp.]
MAFSSRNLINFARTALRAVRHAASGPAKPPGSSGKTSRPPHPSSPSFPRSSGASSGTSSGGARGYAGDYRGRVSPVYAPQPDGSPDPGEVVWAWVPYEEDPSQGKDRPVLLIGRDGRKLLGLMLTTRDRNNASGSDPDYLDIGTGAWDSLGRPSEVKLDRILQLDPGSVRREGAVMDRARFEVVAARLAVRNR